MTCSHSMGTVGRPCPWCKQIVTTAPAAVTGGGEPEARRTLEATPATIVAAATSPASRGSALRKAAAVAIAVPGPSTLFDMPEPTAPADLRPAARFTDPATSHAAAASITESRQHDRYLAVLGLLAERGRLSDFDLARLTGVKQTSIGKRRGELEAIGLVVRVDSGGVSDTGSPCLRFAITDAGRAHLGAVAA